MTSLPSFSKGNYLPESYNIPEDPTEMKAYIKNVLESQSRLINRKETAQYETVEIQNNQTYPGDSPQSKKYIYRKLISLGTLATGLNTVAHGIATGGAGSTYVFTRGYGYCYNQATPLWAFFSNNTVDIEVNGGNVLVTIPAKYNGFTGYVVLEFFKG